jgi:hypothetical protein
MTIGGQAMDADSAPVTEVVSLVGRAGLNRKFRVYPSVELSVSGTGGRA